MRSLPARPLSLMCICAMTAGCGLPVLGLRDDADLHHASFHDKLTARDALMQEFLACTRRPHDERGSMPDSVHFSKAVSSGKPSTDERSSRDGLLAPVRALIKGMRDKGQPRAD